MAEVTDDIRETVSESYASAAKADAASPEDYASRGGIGDPRLCVVVEDTNKVVIFVMSGDPHRMSSELQNSKTPTWLARRTMEPSRAGGDRLCLPIFGVS
jgi:hypothetical protein